MSTKKKDFKFKIELTNEAADIDIDGSSKAIIIGLACHLAENDLLHNLFAVAVELAKHYKEVKYKS